MSINDAIAGAQAQLLAAAKAHTLTVAETLIDLTPAHTGRTRCSFEASIGAPATGTDRGHEAADPSGAPALEQIRGVVDAMQPGEVLFVTSDYPNAARLNDGDRSQAPREMLARATMRFADGD